MCAMCAGVQIICSRPLGLGAQEVRDRDVLRAAGGAVPAPPDQEGVVAQLAVHAARGAPQGGHAADQGAQPRGALPEARASAVIQVS